MLKCVVDVTQTAVFIGYKNIGIDGKIIYSDRDCYLHKPFILPPSLK